MKYCKHCEDCNVIRGNVCLVIIIAIFLAWSIVLSLGLLKLAKIVAPEVLLEWGFHL